METWKPLHNFPNYEGSDKGRIRNVRTRRVLQPTVTSQGYAMVGLRRDGKTHTTRVHQVIAKTFLGDHPGLDVRHRDRDKLKNDVDNLCWSTRSETIGEAYAAGTKKPWKQIGVRVVETGEEFETIKACAMRTGCDKSDIRRYLQGERNSVKGLHFERI